MVRLAEHPDVLAAVDAILNNGGVCEIKIERKGTLITVVETGRKIKYQEEIRDKR